MAQTSRAAALSTMVPYGNLTNTRRIMPASEAPVATKRILKRRIQALMDFSPRSHRVTSMQSASVFCVVAISQRPKRKTKTRAASRLSTKKWQRNFSRRVTRSDSGFATHKRRRTVRLTKWKLSGLSPHIDTKLSATKFRAGSLSRSGKLTTATSIFASA